jgi:hypothetical protein
MQLFFHAAHVDGSNAIDWEIQQVLFDAVSDEVRASDVDRHSPYVLSQSPRLPLRRPQGSHRPWGAGRGIFELQDRV